MKMYSSYEEEITFKDFYIEEIKNKGNYSEQDYNEWCNKYDLSDDSVVTWTMADNISSLSYLSDEGDDFVGTTDTTEYDIVVEDIIEESDDGNNGFLIILER